MNQHTDWSLYEEFNTSIGDEFDLGVKSFGEKEIIEYARINDPLPFHLSMEDAKRSFFGNLVCSGGQAFYFFYVNRFVPLFGPSTVGGLGIQNWEFIQPIAVDEEINSKAICRDIHPSKSNPKLLIVVWVFEFRHKSGTLAQSLEIKILHKRKSKA